MKIFLEEKPSDFPEDLWTELKKDPHKFLNVSKKTPVWYALLLSFNNLSNNLSFRFDVFGIFIGLEDTRKIVLYDIDLVCESGSLCLLVPH